ncbi:nuclear transport factor 2 family protein [Algihabitans sp.]|uniref:nuclear transport factor 2 family protein n=1 Tax=Algihabitans sp. TaxID=2821514 RepID=UPI003BA8EE60
MSRPLTSKGLFVSVVAILGVLSMPVKACEEKLGIAYQTGGDGRLHILVNEVTLHPDLASSQGNWIAPDLLLPGENTLEIVLSGPEGVANAKTEIFVGCEGVFPDAPGENAESLLLTEIDTPGRVSEAFFYDDVPGYVYLNAEPTDDDGLEAAIEDLRKVARSGDVAGFLTYHDPLLHDARLVHPEREGLLNHMAMLFLTSGDFDVMAPKEITIKPVLGGRAYQAIDPSGQGPLRFVGKDGSESAGQTIAQARIWMKTAEGWRVLRN